MLIDTHAHVNFKGFEADAEEVLLRALDAGVSVVNVGTQLDTSKQAVEMAEKFKVKSLKLKENSENQAGVYAVVGLHPVHTYTQHLDEEETSFNSREEKFDHEAYKKLAEHPLVVGIGECGLDYFRLNEHTGYKIEDVKQLQKNAFIQQIKLAIELNKALVIHTRSSKGTDDACLDVLEIMKQELRIKNQELRFVLHSYTGSPEVAKMFVDLGAYISFNGIITFDRPKNKNSRSSAEALAKVDDKTGNQEAVLREVPDDKILLETDCPYLTPAPHRGKRNEPLFVQHVAEKVAQIKKISADEIAEMTTNNAKKLFNIN